MNIIAWLEYELAYYDSVVHCFYHYTTRTPLEAMLSTSLIYVNDKILFFSILYHSSFWNQFLGFILLLSISFIESTWTTNFLCRLAENEVYYFFKWTLSRPLLPPLRWISFCFNSNFLLLNLQRLLPHFLTSQQLCLLLQSPIIRPWRCPWCNGYRHRNWTRRYEFKSWTRLIAFHIALIPLGKVWIQLFSLQLWVNSRTD